MEKQMQWWALVERLLGFTLFKTERRETSEGLERCIPQKSLSLVKHTSYDWVASVGHPELLHQGVL